MASGIYRYKTPHTGKKCIAVARVILSLHLNTHSNDDPKMRPHEVYVPDIELKGQWLEETIKSGRRPDLVFEARASAVEIYRSQGTTCVQVL